MRECGGRRGGDGDERMWRGSVGGEDGDERMWRERVLERMEGEDGNERMWKGEGVGENWREKMVMRVCGRGRGVEKMVMTY